MAMAAKTWKGSWWQYGGGGNPWNAFSYDAELGLVYLGMGNGGPWSQKTRSPGGGDNLFLASIVAVKVETGEYVWHYQNTPGEIWDYPAAMDMILADLEIDGKKRKVLMQAPKNGFFYVIDRETGEFLSAENFVRVTWAKYVDPDTGRPVETEGARLESGPMEIAPDFSGGHSWYPMSFNPGTGLAYIPYLQSSAILAEPDFAGWEFTRGAFDMPVMKPSTSPVSGGLLAWDPVTQKQAWRFELPSIHLGGTATTAGGLVFAGSGDGRLLAFNARTGEQLWDAPANNAVMGGPAIYSVDDEQYVTVLAGIGGGFAQKFNLIDYGYQYGKDRRLLAFKLGGKASLPDRVPVHVDKTMAPLSDDPLVKRGADLYMPYCGTCHGFAALNAGVTPVLRTSPMLDALPAILLDGALVDQGMPAFGHFLSMDDVKALQAYLKELASLGD
jgi:PQQ-dependent dehydrogenase (methanol/ethanol family)